MNGFLFLKKLTSRKPRLFLLFRNFALLSAYIET